MKIYNWRTPTQYDKNKIIVKVIIPSIVTEQERGLPSVTISNAATKFPLILHYQLLACERIETMLWKQELCNGANIQRLSLSTNKPNNKTSGSIMPAYQQSRISEQLL